MQSLALVRHRTAFDQLHHGVRKQLGVDTQVAFIPVSYTHLEGKTVLLEGQLGTMKDPDFGIYPMTTSSNTLAGYGCIGAGIPPRYIEDIVAVTKAYSSSVGGGDFVSEIFGEEADELRKRGGDKGEFGATTGRPRRVGWFDAVATRYGVEMQGATEVLSLIHIWCSSMLHSSQPKHSAVKHQRQKQRRLPVGATHLYLAQAPQTPPAYKQVQNSRRK